MPNYSQPLVFINYRRADARAESGRLAGDLERAFGEGFVFQDVEDIHGGDNWIDALIEAGNQSKVILAVIGPQWLQRDEHGISRLDDPTDWVRKELESAINQSKTIIPITVNDGLIPAEDDLPPSLQALLHHQAFDIRTDRWKHDVHLLVKQLEKLTEAKAIPPDRLKKLLKFARIIGLLMVPLIAGFFVFNSYNKQFDDVGSADITEVYSPEVNPADTLNTATISSNKKSKFCPEFSSNVDVKTLLFPFSRADGGDYSIENFIQQRISRTCSKFGIQVDIGKPSVDGNTYFDLQKAKQKCAVCVPDILLTGLSFKDNAGNYGVQADFGFCDPFFEGLIMNEDLMEISVASIPISSLSSNPDIQESVEHVLQVYLGIYFAKNGKYEKSLQILNETVKDQNVDRTLKQEAYKVIWQNEYKLDKKAECVKTLQKMYDLDNKNLKAVATQSVILFDESEYADAIKRLDVLVDKTSNPEKKETFIVKRADAKFQNKQYANAKQDYLKVKQTPKVKSKVIMIDKKIEANKYQIDQLNANINNLTIENKVNLAKLHLENGNTVKSNAVLKSVNISEVKASTIKLNPELFNRIKPNHTIINNRN